MCTNKDGSFIGALLGVSLPRWLIRHPCTCCSTSRRRPKLRVTLRHTCFAAKRRRSDIFLSSHRVSILPRGPPTVGASPRGRLQTSGATGRSMAKTACARLPLGDILKVLKESLNYAITSCFSFRKKASIQLFSKSWFQGFCHENICWRFMDSRATMTGFQGKGIVPPLIMCTRVPCPKLLNHGNFQKKS